MSRSRRPGGRDPRGGGAWPRETPAPPPDPYERMLRDWAACGMMRLEGHLTRHAAFEEYLRTRRPEVGPQCETSSDTPTTSAP